MGRRSSSSTLVRPYFQPSITTPSIGTPARSCGSWTGHQSGLPKLRKPRHSLPQQAGHEGVLEHMEREGWATRAGG
ncbi:unnamed protein product [Musa acuminata subsp. burmannicoides]